MTDPLRKELAVIDSLEVGPPRLEKRRVLTPYRLFREGRQEASELIYRYEEDVFEPGDPSSLNLACLLGAQVAVNYGLFCRRIVFRGLFDAHDRRFLRAMSRCTAREIYVKKILQPNPFLVGDTAALPLVRKGSYLHAELLFPDPPAATATWMVEPDRYIVLMSGGKESLLSYGLLAEIADHGRPRGTPDAVSSGNAVHPVFINESGRHWYTALNSYRYFKNHFQETARVWTSADRVFSWMLRQLPFIRRDYFRVRSDDYPLRMWTVPVFIFGALPLVRKRGIGRLVMGDEYDTTRVDQMGEVVHFDGLYDQSIFFDRAISRYFSRKGWGVRQLSVLRQVSELVVERLLAERYPALFQNQTSCHMASIRGGRAFPCGRCEKCHRVVGMLLALGPGGCSAGSASPCLIGYSPEQVSSILKNLPSLELHQEAPAARHLLHLLASGGHIPPVQEAAPFPEIEKIRIHPRVSPIEEIPEDIREPLFGILLPYTRGAVVRRGDRWCDFNILTA